MKAHYLKLNQLRFIAALKRRGKLSLAAEEMNISQPAASRTLADIEALVGRQICTRNAHGFVFNEFGDVLAARASRVVAEVDVAQIAVAAAVAAAVAVVVTDANCRSFKQ